MCLGEQSMAQRQNWLRARRSALTWLTLIATLFAFGCDNSGVSTRESPQYIVRPSQEIVFPILVVGRSISKELEIENIGGVDLIIAQSIIQTNVSQSGEFTIEYRYPNSETYETISFEEGPEGSEADRCFAPRRPK
jgi:hypothetical protein